MVPSLCQPPQLTLSVAPSCAWCHHCANTPNLPYLWLHLAHGAVAATHDVGACAGEELSHPAETADEEAGVDEEEDEGGVPTRILPVYHKRQLKQQTTSQYFNVHCLR